MRVIALKTLRLFWEQHPDARQALQAWYRDTKRATWTTPADIRTVYRNASFVGHNRVVFNIRAISIVWWGDQLCPWHCVHLLYWLAPRLR
jgi:mRNA-degrading endonuclease HigB of HigAB toxin-antitoxin module